MLAESKRISSRLHISPCAILSRFSSCEILGIDAYAEDDLGYAPS